MGFDCVLIVVNNGGVTIDREVLVNVNEMQYETAKAALTLRHPKEAVVLLTENDLADYTKAIEKKRRGF